MRARSSNSGTHVQLVGPYCRGSPEVPSTFQCHCAGADGNTLTSSQRSQNTQTTQPHKSKANNRHAHPLERRQPPNRMHDATEWFSERVRKRKARRKPHEFGSASHRLLRKPIAQQASNAIPETDGADAGADSDDLSGDYFMPECRPLSVSCMPGGKLRGAYAASAHQHHGLTRPRHWIRKLCYRRFSWPHHSADQHTRSESLHAPQPATLGHA